jgi:hypothetical protein
MSPFWKWSGVLSTSMGDVMNETKKCSTCVGLDLVNKFAI